MGPHEQALSQVAGFDPTTLEAKAVAWHDAAQKIDVLLDDLDITATRVAEGWENGADAEAAQAAFVAKRQHLMEYKARMVEAKEAVRVAKRGLNTAKTRYENLPPVGPAPVGPDPLDASASDEERESHNEAVRGYNAASASHAGQIQAREEQARDAVRALELEMKNAQSKLTTAAPPVPQESGGGVPPTAPSTPTSTNGPSSTPVVGGNTSTGHLITPGHQHGTELIGIGRPEDGYEGIGTGNGTDTSVAAQTGATQTGATQNGTIGQVGGIGGGGMGGMAASAGALGAGRSILGRLTGGSAGAAASGPGRTAGMQNGSTLGSRTAGQSSAAARGATSSTSGSQAGQSGTRGSQAGQSGTRGSQAGQSGTRGSQAGQPGGRGAQAGARGSQAGAGSRGAGSRGAGQTSGARGGAGSGRGSRGQGDQQDPTVNHMAFDDQWLDDDDTAPGVIA